MKLKFIVKDEVTLLQKVKKKPQRDLHYYYKLIIKYLIRTIQ